MSEPTPPLGVDVRPFKGFIAIDGSTHLTSKLAIEHSRELKVKKAFADLAATIAQGATTVGSTIAGAIDADVAGPVIDLSNPVRVAEFLFAFRNDVIAAANQDVRLRAPRADKGVPRPARTPKKVPAVTGAEARTAS
jgi:hypothetical protein